MLKTDLPADRSIRAVDFKPGNRKVVHHIIAGIDTSGRARELDAKDAKPGYEAVGGFGDGVPLRGFLPIWTPGSRARYQPEGSGYLLPSKADLLIQMHYHKSGKPETDSTQVGLYLSDKPLSKQVRTGFLFPEIKPEIAAKLREKFMAADGDRQAPQPGGDLPGRPGDPRRRGRLRHLGELRGGQDDDGPADLTRDILLTSVMPHMHWLGRDFRFEAVLPDEKKTRLPLIKIDRWDFNWQGTYAFAEPIRLPKGTHFEMVAHFDNSESQPRQPQPPAQGRHLGRADHQRDVHRHLRVHPRRRDLQGRLLARAQAGREALRSAGARRPGGKPAGLFPLLRG